MNTELPSVIATFFRAFNRRETHDIGALFTDSAVVIDEEQTYRGAAIKGWVEEATTQYQPIAEVTDFIRQSDKIIVTAQVSGTFPGSPAQIRYNFTLENDKIAALNIGA